MHATHIKADVATFCTRCDTKVMHESCCVFPLLCICSVCTHQLRRCSTRDGCRSLRRRKGFFFFLNFWISFATPVQSIVSLQPERRATVETQILGKVKQFGGDSEWDHQPLTLHLTRCAGEERRGLACRLVGTSLWQSCVFTQCGKHAAGKKRG